MNTIYKYRLTAEAPCVVQMPRFAQPLSVGAQGDELFVWALVDTDQREESVEFYVFGTGHEIPQGDPGELPLRFIGTAFMPLPFGMFVWHVFTKAIERNIGDLLLETIGKA